MTTVIYRNGTIVGDGMVQQNYTSAHITQKVFKLDDGRLVGMAGQMNHCQAFVRHLIAPGTYPLPPMNQLQALVIHPNDHELIYEFAWDNIPCTFRSDCAAIGSGTKLALSLLRTTNITAMAAMKAVAELDVNTGPPFMFESFKRRRQNDFSWITRLPFSPDTLKFDRYHIEAHQDDDDTTDVKPAINA